jgi:nucleoside-diphosphate-sugar epimerase
MRCAVTGGAGFIGGHLVDALLSTEGTDVLVLDNLRRGRLANLAKHDGHPRFRFLPADVRDVEAVHGAMAGAELVYHLAAQSNVMGALSDPRYSFETNVCGTYNVLEAAASAGVRRVVFASSREVYGDALALPVGEQSPLAAKNTYGASKVAGEAYCATFANVFGLETAVLRFANVYGPCDRDRVIPLWLDRAVAGDDLEVYGGDQVIDFVPVRLAVQALLRAADAQIVGQPVNVGSGEGTPLLALAQRIIEVTGSTSEVRILPSRGAEVRRFVADVERMRTVLGLQPPPDPLEALPMLAAQTMRVA